MLYLRILPILCSFTKSIIWILLYLGQYICLTEGGTERGVNHGDKMGKELCDPRMRLHLPDILDTKKNNTKNVVTAVSAA